MQKLLEKTIFGCIFIIWLSHLAQVFTPEVGFDAVWYHLPVVKAILEAQSLVFLPNLYQSLNPLLSDLIFGIGYFFAQDLGAKIVAYIFGLFLIVSTFFLSRQFLNKFWSLIVILIVSTFQVIAWQSASFYIDVAKAFWEVVALVALIKWQESQKQKWLIATALSLGASLATKLFSLFLLPIFLYLVFAWSSKKSWQNVLFFLCWVIILPLPFYLFAAWHTDNPFFSFFIHLDKLGEIGGQSSLFLYLLQRITSFLTLPIELVLGKDYTSIVLLIFLPVTLFFWREIKKNRSLMGLAIFTLWQILLWWYLPPLSTRYALSGFITWTILAIWSVVAVNEKNTKFLMPILITIFLAVLLNLVPRFFVNLRSWKYLSGKQTKEQYIHQFFDGNIDQHLQAWHKL